MKIMEQNETWDRRFSETYKDYEPKPNLTNEEVLNKHLGHLGKLIGDATKRAILYAMDEYQMQGRLPLTYHKAMDNKKGLYSKYFIQKIVPNPKYGVEHESTFMGLDATQPTILKPAMGDFFVLRLDKDDEHGKACRLAINVYADAIKEFLPELSKDLKEKYPSINLTPINPEKK